MLGFYGRLVAAVAAITPGRIVALCRCYDPERREDARTAFGEMDLRFLVPLGLGMATALLLVGVAVTVLEERYPAALFGFFAGLIAVSAVVLARDLALETSGELTAGIVGVVAAFVVAGGLFTFDGTGPLVIAAMGALAMGATILPGLSGALLLLLFGRYASLLSELAAFVSALFGVLDGGSLVDASDPARTVVAFVLGGIVGLVAIARVVRAALDRWREATFTFLVGLIAGAVRAPVAEAGRHADILTQDALLAFLAWAVVGGTLVFGADRAVGGFGPE